MLDRVALRNPFQELSCSLRVLTSICAPEHAGRTPQCLGLGGTDALDGCRVSQAKLMGCISSQLRDLSEALLGLAISPTLGCRELVSTYQLAVVDKVETILVPQITVGALHSLLNQLDKYTGDICDMDVAPSALPFAHLDCLSGFDGNSDKFGNLHAALIDGASSLTIDDGWEN